MNVENNMNNTDNKKFKKILLIILIIAVILTVGIVSIVAINSAKQNELNANMAQVQTETILRNETAVQADKEGKKPIEIATRYHNMIKRDIERQQALL